MRRRWWVWPILLILALASALAADSPAVVKVDNGLISLSVNNTGDGRGRFAVDVTGGDPARTEDDGQALIYGRPVPWTSYTTVLVDGKAYLFGDPTTKRAGQGLPAGEMVRAPAADGGKILATWRFGEVEVTQELSTVEGLTTGQPDTARIAYTIVNRGQKAHRVGLRLCLDTMLGANDGAPFRLGDQQILTDSDLEATGRQPYWQAFDSLDDPRVIAQGTLSGGELTPPDRLVFTNWGTLADNGWEVPLSDGRDFTRAGEFELDSAAALYWNSVSIAHGAILRRATYYGLGSVTISRGDLTLGLTAPASISSGQPFTVLAYLENRGKGVAQEVVLSLQLPINLKAQSPVRVTIGRLKPGESRQILWTVDSSGSGTATLQATAEAFDLPATTVRRTVKLDAPARIVVTVPELTPVGILEGRYQPYPFVITAKISNQGGHVASNVQADFLPVSGLLLAQADSPERWVGQVEPGQETIVHWSVVKGSDTEEAMAAEFQIKATYLEGAPSVTKQAFTWPSLAEYMLVTMRPDRPGWFKCVLTMVNCRKAKSLVIRLKFDPAFRLITVMRGGFMINDAGSSLPFARKPEVIDGELVLSVNDLEASRLDREVLATVWLAGPEQSSPNLAVGQLVIRDEAGAEIPASVLYEE